MLVNYPVYYNDGLIFVIIRIVTRLYCKSPPRRFCTDLLLAVYICTYLCKYYLLLLAVYICTYLCKYCILLFFLCIGMSIFVSYSMSLWTNKATSWIKPMCFQHMTSFPNIRGFECFSVLWADLVYCLLVELYCTVL